MGGLNKARQKISKMARIAIVIVGVLSGKEWVEIHYEFWSNSVVPDEKSGV